MSGALTERAGKTIREPGRKGSRIGIRHRQQMAVRSQLWCEAARSGSHGGHF